MATILIQSTYIVWIKELHPTQQKSQSIIKLITGEEIIINENFDDCKELQYQPCKPWIELKLIDKPQK